MLCSLMLMTMLMIILHPQTLFRRQLSSLRDRLKIANSHSLSSSTSSRFAPSNSHTHALMAYDDEHAHADAVVYICVCVCVYVVVSELSSSSRLRERSQQRTALWESLLEVRSQSSSLWSLTCDNDSLCCAVCVYVCVCMTTGGSHVDS